MLIVLSEVAFFDNNFANQALLKNGKADAILAANVMCHIPDLNEIAKASKKILKDDGVLIFEDPYLGDMIKGMEFNENSRVPNPDRKVQAYNQSASTQNLIRAVS